MKKLSQKFLIIFLTLAIQSTSGFINSANAQVLDDLPSENSPAINLVENYQLAASGTKLTAAAFDDKLKIIIERDGLLESSELEMQIINEPLPMPWKLKKVSSIYQYEFKNKKSLNAKKLVKLQLSYENPANNYRQIFFYDKNYQSWRPLPSSMSEKFISSNIALPFARIAVFEYPEITVTGSASWYKYKNGLFAASPDFPKGSRIRVYNADKKDKFVDVTINDYGPDRNLHPNRVIDLDKVAFKAIAPLGQGTVNVRIEPLSIPNVNGKFLNIPATGLAAEPKINSKSAIVINSKTGQVLWSKNASSSLPIASLTKLVAIKVFLDSKPSLNQVVPYKKADEEYNYKYANKYEIARLRVADGETMTIEDLLYSALVGSANNAVESLVRVSGLTRPKFIERMNELVKSWGASSTYFVEPTGLSPENVSSAFDYAIISNKILGHPIIEKASKISSYKFKTINTKQPHTIKNTNQLITMNKVKVTGSKTGYLHEAGYCLMTRASNKSNREVIVVTLGSPNKNSSFDETEELVNFGLTKIQ